LEGVFCEVQQLDFRAMMVGMDGDIANLRRLLRMDPFNKQAHFRLVCELKRHVLPFLEESVHAILAGVPMGRRGIRRAWFDEHWAPVSYRANRLNSPELAAGPFSTLKGADLHASEMRLRDLRACSLRGANLEGADLWSADLRGAVLNKAQLGGANLIRAQLTNADLSYTDLTRVDFIHADLRGANMQGAVLDRANLRGAKLEGADFRGASLFATKIFPWPRPDVLLDDNTLWPNGLRAKEQHFMGNVA
jgi:uncharacterized protein YjbI with pentapeptide repeats